MNKLEKAYSMGRLDRIVIDEVHCVSQWGHDFRPDYKILGILKRQFPQTSILGLTATASKKVLGKHLDRFIYLCWQPRHIMECCQQQIAKVLIRDSLSYLIT